MGKNLDSNHEAAFFAKYNTWLLSSAGGRWDNPLCMKYLYEDKKAMELAVLYLKKHISSFPCLEYLGFARFLKYRSLFHVAEPWGWKDPKNSLTLAVWRQIFPKAKIVHVVRNGIDVANSLFKRQVKGFEIAKNNIKNHPFLFMVRKKKGWFGTSPRVINHLEGFKLWEEYMESFSNIKKSMDRRYMEIRYEDLLDVPEAQLSGLLEFCNVSPDNSRMDNICKDINSGRSYAFFKETEMKKLWEKLKDTQWMKIYGYDKING